MADESGGTGDRGPAHDSSAPGQRPTWLSSAGEMLAIFLVFAATAAWPVPDVNEAVYLTKARHAADPTWAAGDFFLETPDAHGVFYVLFGPVAAALPLAQAAWLGRVLGWLALAAGFWHAVRPLLTAPGLRGTAARIVAAAIFAVAIRTTTAAGEWVLGGCEAKVFAWAGVLAGVGEIARGRLAGAVLFCGAATAAHPIVGGWGLLAAVCADPPLDRLLKPKRQRAAEPGHVMTRSTVAAAVMIAGGLGLALVGIVPALGLSAGVDAAERAAAVKTYVAERLAHHLRPFTFAEPLVARHLLAILVWWLLTRLERSTAARRRVHRFTLAALGISLAGWLLACLEPFAPSVVLGLLRFYWFRLADIMVPFSLAVTAAAVWEDDAACDRLLPGRARLVQAGLVLLLALDLAAQRSHWPLPGASVTPRSDTHVDARAWADICDWVAVHTPPDARFLTPRGSATFTWRTGRPEVVSWKNSPQDAASLVEWRRRILDCFSRDGRLADMERSTATIGVERLRAVAQRYAADFAIVPMNVVGLEALPFPRVHANAGYVVLDLRGASETP
jgi:hypothetical protein